MIADQQKRRRLTISAEDRELERVRREGSNQSALNYFTAFDDPTVGRECPKFRPVYKNCVTLTILEDERGKEEERIEEHSLISCNGAKVTSLQVVLRKDVS